MRKLLNLLEFTEKNKKTRFIYNLFCPIFYLVELLCFLYYWQKIKIQLLTNENIVSFLEKNEFGYKWYKLYKMDIIDPDEIYYSFNLEEIAVKIRYEFTKELIRIISENTAFDIENYITLQVYTEIIPGNIKKYEVDIKYFRYYLIKQNLKNLIIWLIITISVYFLLINVNINWINN